MTTINPSPPAMSHGMAANRVRSALLPRRVNATGMIRRGASRMVSDRARAETPTIAPSTAMRHAFGRSRARIAAQITSATASAPIPSDMITPSWIQRFGWTAASPAAIHPTRRAIPELGSTSTLVAARRAAAPMAMTVPAPTNAVVRRSNRTPLDSSWGKRSQPGVASSDVSGGWLASGA